MLTIRENQPLAPLTTFGIGGPARYFVAVRTAPEIPEALAWAEARGLPVFILGGGSNLLVPDNGFGGLVMQIDLRGVIQDKPWSPDFIVGAGEPWDQFVDQAIEANCAGVECLAGIPGSTGGTPVQNVGAYGQEVSQTIRQVHVYDRVDKQFRQLNNHECGFRYRESIFNTTARGRYIVTAVVFLLHYGKPNLSYADLQKRFEGRLRSPKLREVAEAVRDIRRSKGMLIVPGDADCRSAGSFFKNPIVDANLIPRIAGALDIEASSIPQWLAGNGKIKIPAAWLLERAGFTKGFVDGAAGISSRHTLALINRGNATFADIERLQNCIIATVRERFGITLEREPVLLG